MSYALNEYEDNRRDAQYLERVIVVRHLSLDVMQYKGDRTTGIVQYTVFIEYSAYVERHFKLNILSLMT
jgi:hypothetical protein